MSDCIFCKIGAGDIPADELYRDDTVVAFRDLSPQAPVHILVIPTQHISSLADAGDALEGDLGHLLAVAARVAREHVGGDGYRVVINVGEHGGQTVPHLHVHILGGRAMTWPPG